MLKRFIVILAALAMVASACSSDDAGVAAAKGDDSLYSEHDPDLDSSPKPSIPILPFVADDGHSHTDIHDVEVRIGFEPQKCESSCSSS